MTENLRIQNNKNKKKINPFKMQNNQLLTEKH